MSKKIKIPVVLPALMAAAVFTLSSMWLIIGAITMMTSLAGWHNYDFITNISTEVLVSVPLAFISGVYLMYVYDTQTNQEEKQLC